MQVFSCFHRSGTFLNPRNSQKSALVTSLKYLLNLHKNQLSHILMNVSPWQVFFLERIWKYYSQYLEWVKTFLKLFLNQTEIKWLYRLHKSEIPVLDLCNIEVINPNGFWTSKVWKIHFTPSSWETRIDFWVYSPISHHYPSHLGMVLQQLFWAQSFQHLLGSQGKNEASCEGLSKLDPENGKSQSMARSPALVVMS